MTWYYNISPSHTHVRVFMNGALCGNLCFRNEEFEEIKGNVEYSDFSFITLINEPQPKAPLL